MHKILVIAEQLDGKLKRSTLSAVKAARELAGRLSAEIHVLLLGQNLGPASQELAAYGGNVLHVADSPALAQPLAEAYSQVIAQAVKDLGADHVVATATSQSKDILPRVACKLGAGMVSDVLEFRGEDSEVIYRRSMWAGAILADVAIRTPIRVFTVRAAAFGAADKAESPAPVQPLAVAVDQARVRAKFVKREEVKLTRPSLNDARIVVSGGRGTKGDFKPIEALADALGAAVGASRAAVDAGWVPGDYQVGQTGKTVAPDLYIAVGISGAIQHMAGMKNSKVIVAINKDPDAPIFQIADYGLVGDLTKLVPELIAALPKR